MKLISIPNPHAPFFFPPNSNPQVESIMKVIRKWGKENGLKL